MIGDVNGQRVQERVSRLSTMSGQISLEPK